MHPAIKLFAVAALAGAQVAATRSSHMIATPVACQGFNEAADQFRLYVTSFDTATSTAAAGQRNFWHIPQVAASEISFVADFASCDRAARLHAVTTGEDSTNPTAVFLLRVGPTRYITFNFTNVGEWFHYAILDSSLSIVGTRGS